MRGMAAIYSQMGRRKEAIALYEETFRLQKEKVGTDDPSTLTTMCNLAENYRAGGRVKDAAVMSEQLVKLEKAKLEPSIL